MVPVPSTARRFTTVPSYTPQFPPTSTSSSMITGSAPTGSSTPPICDAAEMWQLRPTCAQLPTSAWESTIVPSPTYAPTLMYMGGMQVTPRADETAVANARSAGHDADAARAVELLHRVGGLVEQRLPGRVDGHVHDLAHAEAEQDPLLHPGIHAPAGRGGCVRLGGPHLAASSAPA